MLNIIPKGENILDVDLERFCNSILIPVNTVGVMGKGLALQFKTMYPEYFKVYNRICNDGRLNAGQPLVLGLGDSGVVNYGWSSGTAVMFPTKVDWIKSSKLEYVKWGLLELAASNDHTYLTWRKRTKNIHIPRLGCGCGGLDWGDVRPLIENFADMMPDHEIYLYE